MGTHMIVRVLAIISGSLHAQKVILLEVQQSILSTAQKSHSACLLVFALTRVCR